MHRALILTAALVLMVAAVFAAPASLEIFEVLSAAAIALLAYVAGWRSIAAAVVLFAISLRFEGPEEALEHAGISLVIVAAIATVRSISERLRLSDRKLRAIVSSMDDVIIVFGRDGTYLDVAPTSTRMLLRTPAEMVGKRLADFYDEATAARFLERINAAIDRKQTVTIDYSLPGEGRERWFSGAVSPLGEESAIWVARDITARKEAADEALRESQVRCRCILEHASDIICTIDAAGTITSLNSAFQCVLGWRAEDWIGRSFLDILAPEDVLHARGQLARARIIGEIPLARNIVLKKDGSRAILESAVVRHVASGGVVEFLCIARDVTESARALEELRRSEQQLADSQRIAKLGSFEVDLVSGEARWSDEHFRIFGLEPGLERASTELFYRFVRPGDVPLAEEVWRTAIEKGENEWEQTIVLPDGSERVLSTRARVSRDEGGTPVRMIGTAQDITERKLAEEKLRETEERFALLARATKDGVYDWDVKNDKLWWSSGEYELFGFDKGLEPTVGMWREHIHPEDRDRVWGSFQTAVATGEHSWSQEYRSMRASGTYAIVLDRALIVRDAAMNLVRVIGSNSDITEYRQLQEQLAQARRVTSLGRVAASIAHEVNNVLMGIQPNVELIKRSVSSIPALTGPIDHVLQSVQRGKRVTEEILRYTRHSEPVLQSVAVAGFFHRWADEIRPVLPPEIALTIEAGDDLHVEIDPLQIAQVFTNLALNARDAMAGRGGALTISASSVTSFGSFSFGVIKTADRYVHIMVMDAGCGMTSEQLAHMFEPLYTTKKSGTGLGLAISYRYVQQHQGHMFVESEPGRGSVFHVFLPAALPAHHAVESPAEQQLPAKRILLVEDDIAVASGIKSLLEIDGCEVEMVHSGGEAAAAIARFDPHCVILDIGLPDMTGVDVYRIIAGRWPSLPVLFSSGHADASQLESIRRSNVGVLLKPYDYETLRTALIKLIPDEPPGNSLAAVAG